MEISEKDQGITSNDADNNQERDNEQNIPEKREEANINCEEKKNTSPNTAEDNKTAEEGSRDDPVVLDDILSQIVQDTIIDGSTANNNMQDNNNKRKPPGIIPKQPPVKVRRQAEPRIRSAPSVFLQRSSRPPPAPKQVVRKNMADQFNNCVHGDPGDYICSDCFYNRWQAERDYLQPIQTT